ncbi:MAG: transcriptional regulator [Candidatus Hermodarchaeota archaeon]
MTAVEDQEKDIKTILELDDIIHSPARLAILTFLLPRGHAPFTLIRKALGLTAGNLSSHLRKLENKDLVRIHKKFIDAKPTSIIFLNDRGREAIIEYASNLSLVLKNMLKETKEQ